MVNNVVHNVLSKPLSHYNWPFKVFPTSKSICIFSATQECYENAGYILRFGYSNVHSVVENGSQRTVITSLIVRTVARSLQYGDFTFVQGGLTF